MSTKHYSLIVLFAVVSILVSFYSGFFLKEITLKSKDFSETPRNYMPYFQDEIIIITKDKPRYTLIASTARFTSDNVLYKHRQKIFFFDGTSWQKMASDMYTENTDIKPTSYMPKWEIKDDPSLVLKQSVSGQVDIEKYKISFEVPTITNELGIRSLSNYTIFRSEADAEMTINGVQYDSNVLYTRTYSYNAAIESIAISNPIGIKTDWFAFWDENGNFYNVDETVVDDTKRGEYKSHSIAVFKDSEERVVKSFDNEIQKINTGTYQVKTSSPTEKEFYLNFINSFNKDETNKVVNNSIGQIEGYVTSDAGKTIKGFGIYEYIYQ